MIKVISKYETFDGKQFDSEEKAETHIQNCLGETIQILLREGGANWQQERKIALYFCNPEKSLNLVNKIGEILELNITKKYQERDIEFE